MSALKQWVFDPDAGGVKIPERIKREVQRRVETVAEKHLTGKYTRLGIHFRGQFCYIDAYREPPKPNPGWPPKDWPETTDAYLERLRNTPTHLCRLRYFGDDRWGYAFYLYSREKYELTYFPDGEFFGKPEDAFLEAARLYLDSEAPL
jgi:hypothetical protein